MVYISWASNVLALVSSVFAVRSSIESSDDDLDSSSQAFDENNALVMRQLQNAIIEQRVDCHWNWRKARCEPVGECEYRFGVGKTCFPKDVQHAVEQQQTVASATREETVEERWAREDTELFRSVINMSANDYASNQFTKWVEIKDGGKKPLKYGDSKKTNMKIGCCFYGDGVGVDKYALIIHCKKRNQIFEYLEDCEDVHADDCTDKAYGALGFSMKMRAGPWKPIYKSEVTCTDEPKYVWNVVGYGEAAGLVAELKREYVLQDWGGYSYYDKKGENLKRLKQALGLT